jgi:GNAT superfamily N-acetyltransferase
MQTTSFFDISANLSHVDDIAALVASSFSENPAYSSLFYKPSTEQLVPALRWLFRKQIKMQLDAGNKWTMRIDEQSRAIVAVLGAIYPCKDTTFIAKATAFVAWPFKFGVSSALRANRLDALSFRTGMHDTTVFIELYCVCVDERYRGKGVGFSLIMDFLANVELDPRGAKEVRLRTESRRAKRLYKRIGFRTIHKDNVEGFADAPPFASWLMSRPLHVVL